MGRGEGSAYPFFGPFLASPVRHLQQFGATGEWGEEMGRGRGEGSAAGRRLLDGSESLT